MVNAFTDATTQPASDTIAQALGHAASAWDRVAEVFSSAVWR